MVTRLRNTGIGIVDSLPWGSHLCQFYETKQDLLDVLVPYFKTGLENNELCVWVTAAPLAESEAREAMRGVLPHFDRFIDRGQMEIVPYTDWYLQDGSFSQQRVLDAASNRITAMAEKGYSGLRASGNVGWLQKQGWEDFTRYEGLVGSLVGEHQMMTICSYPLGMCGVRESLDVMKNHRLALIKHQGLWQVIENSEQKKTEAVLRQTEEEYRNLFESTQDGMEVIDGSSGRIVLANQAAARMFGFVTPGDLVGVDPLEYIPLEDRERVASMMSEYMFEKDMHKVIELRALRKDGISIWLSAIGVKTEYQERLAGLVSLRDVTEHKQAGQALKDSERRYRLLAENVSDAIWVTDMNMRPTYLSPSYTRLTGYSQEEAMARSAAETLTPASLKVAVETFARALATEQEGHKDAVSNLPPLELEMLRRDGTTICVASTWSFIRDADGRPVEVIGVLRDITARKRADELFAALATSSPVGIYIVSDRTFQFVNPQAEKYFGYSKDEILGMDPLQLVIPEDRSRVRENSVKMLKGERSTPYEYRIVARSGEIRWVTETVSSIQYQGKRAALGNFMDTTEQQQVKERLEESLEKLQRTIEGTVQAIGLTVESRDPFTAGHQRRVAQLAGAMAQEMGFSSEEVRVIRIAGLVHDIGKVCIPSEILCKPGRLSELELSLIKTHCQVAHDILKTVQFPWPLANIVIQHHERIDGSGYPSGLHEDEILIEARILGVADVVEAMTSHRPYRPAPGIDEALEEISRNSGRLYDADAVYACLKLFREKGFAFEDSGLGFESPPV